MEWHCWGVLTREFEAVAGRNLTAPWGEPQRVLCTKRRVFWPSRLELCNTSLSSSWAHSDTYLAAPLH